MNKKMMLMAIAMVLCIACTVGVTLAYLTSKSETVTNTFSVGQVKITLDEAKVDVYGVADTAAARVIQNAYKLIPGHSYTKDPTVHVAANSEACYVFVKVTNEITDIEDGTTIAQQIADNEWTFLENGVYYKQVDAATAAAGTDLLVFGGFEVKDNADVFAYVGKTITITAYAIQADGFATAADAWTAGDWN